MNHTNKSKDCPKSLAILIFLNLSNFQNLQIVFIENMCFEFPAKVVITYS